VAATSVLCTQDTLPVVVGIYLLGLRHPMLAARQLASISQLAPGRLVLGVGVAGEDRSEISNSGVDPATRGRRLDETLDLLRRLAGGEKVDHAGEFFTLAAASILPAQTPRVPIVIGGKGDVAVRRAAQYGDGWLGIFCSPRRFAQTRQQIAEAAAERGRDVPGWYGLSLWCGLDRDPGVARDLLARELTSLYRLPYDKVQHVTPAGTPAQLAKANETAKRDTLCQLTDVVDQGVTAGQFRPVDARTSALAIIGMCNWVAWWHHPNGGRPSGEVADQLADLAVAMVSRHGGSGPREPGPAAALALVRENLDYLERTIRPLTDP
jgi:alkanesulfonate monooxygenase SsuD/methylene tetrahydromethanopterin reductase-like flavin-dependent oxidoreductase (luciferase family)